jgi:hypothetical protein
MIRRLIYASRQLSIALGFVMLSVSTRAAAQPEARPELVFPVNTVVAIRTIDLIDSNSGASNKEYRATVDDSVVVNDVTLAPVGTPAFLRVMRAERAGAVSGRAGVSLKLVALEINGQRVALDTGDATIQSGSQGAKAAKAGAGGAVVGAVLGALLGGKEGAAKGAAVGAAAGVTVAAVSGQRVHVPSETRLSFTVMQGGQTQSKVSEPTGAAVPERLVGPASGPPAQPLSLVGLTPVQVTTAIGRPSFMREGTWYYDTPKGTLRVRFQNGAVSETSPTDFDVAALRKPR